MHMVVPRGIHKFPGALFQLARIFADNSKRRVSHGLGSRTRADISPVSATPPRDKTGETSALVRVARRCSVRLHTRIVQNE